MDNHYYHSLRREAQSQMIAYDQYDRAYWDEYTLLVKANSRLCTKMGLAFERGDLAIARPSYQSGPDHNVKGSYMVIWSFRNQCATELPANKFTVIQEQSWRR